MCVAHYGKLTAQLQSITCRMGSHNVTCYPTQVNVPTLIPARQTNTRFTYPRGIKGWVDLHVGCTSRWFTCPQTVTQSPLQVLATWW